MVGQDLELFYESVWLLLTLSHGASDLCHCYDMFVIEYLQRSILFV